MFPSQRRLRFKLARTLSLRLSMRELGFGQIHGDGHILLMDRNHGTVENQLVLRLLEVTLSTLADHRRQRIAPLGQALLGVIECSVGFVDVDVEGLLKLFDPVLYI